MKGVTKAKADNRSESREQEITKYLWKTEGDRKIQMKKGKITETPIFDQDKNPVERLSYK
jgi:hypothetical protein